jgi:hypothetical protein
MYKFILSLAVLVTSVSAFANSSKIVVAEKTMSSVFDGHKVLKEVHELAVEACVEDYCLANRSWIYVKLDLRCDDLKNRRKAKAAKLDVVNTSNVDSSIDALCILDF